MRRLALATVHRDSERSCHDRNQPSESDVHQQPEGGTPMRLTYDANADAAYIYLVEIAAGEVARTVPVDALASEAMINLDLDLSGRLLGIEVMDASKLLPPELLRASR